jgi:hypothetical protein
MEAPRIQGKQGYARMMFSEVHDCGSYVNVDTGSLFRIPEEALAKGRSPIFEIVSLTGPVVCRLSSDPWVPISKARQLAADADIQINF